MSSNAVQRRYRFTTKYGSSRAIEWSHGAGVGGRRVSRWEDDRRWQRGQNSQGMEWEIRRDVERLQWSLGRGEFGRVLTIVGQNSLWVQ
jgi:hypothetical protein